MSRLDELLDRLEELLEQAEQLDDDTRALVFEILDGVDTLHRTAVARLATALGAPDRERLAGSEPWIRWLFDAYASGSVEEAETALAEISPYIASHGGAVEVLDVTGGIVRVRMAGACSGCTASAITLREGVERALRDALPWFAALDVEEDDAAPHPPPGATLLQIQARPSTP